MTKVIVSFTALQITSELVKIRKIESAEISPEPGVYTVVRSEALPKVPSPVVVQIPSVTIPVIVPASVMFDVDSQIV